MRGFPLCAGVAILLFVAAITVAVFGGVFDGFSLWDGGSSAWRRSPFSWWSVSGPGRDRS